VPGLAWIYRANRYREKNRENSGVGGGIRKGGKKLYARRCRGSMTRGEGGRVEIHQEGRRYEWRRVKKMGGIGNRVVNEKREGVPLEESSR